MALAGAETLDAWLTHLETLHPQKIDLELTRVKTVAHQLGLLPAGCRTVTVAGTNGKGSCVSALSALLRQKGLSVGCYTSPHLLTFNERITINGIPASDAEIMGAFALIEERRAAISLSYFEFATLAALLLFQEKGVAVQILEVGLGGRLDAVNMVDADACVITSIGIDHTEWLGDTRDLIAIEKAGVARLGKPAVVAESDLPLTLLPTLEALGANVAALDRDWLISEQMLTLPDGTQRLLPTVPGLQTSNLGAAVVAAMKLNVTPDQDCIDKAFLALSVPGRQQQLVAMDRLWWLDVAHNCESVARLAAAIAEKTGGVQTHAIFGAMADKPLRAMIELISEGISSWHLPAHEGIARAANPADLAQLIKRISPKATVQCYPTPESAFNGIENVSKPGDRIVVFGSFVTVGAQLACLQQLAITGQETFD
ncbi:folylpolyglutamate synthase/dihydrofolate synthase [marine gamma proteobacterium HTCC2080]|nr:folylpolyglutamate synthase/dihydrofolate synthase [marine gamma proteobacterium HTCC2080]